MTCYQMTPDDDRIKWGLPAEYPMFAPNYAEQRRMLAMSIGLGRTRGKKNAKAQNFEHCAKMEDDDVAGLRAILHGLQSPPENPVTRARKMVELEVPASQRGPGWDRHWRELEAYAATPGFWSDRTARPDPEPTS